MLFIYCISIVHMIEINGKTNPRVLTLNTVILLDHVGGKQMLRESLKTAQKVNYIILKKTLFNSVVVHITFCKSGHVLQ